MLAWLDSDQLVIERGPGPRDWNRMELRTLDVSAGTSRRLAGFADGTSADGWLWATELLDSPSAPGVRPPSPWDPRWTTTWIVLVLAGAGWSIWLVRRRRG